MNLTKQITEGCTITGYGTVDIRGETFTLIKPEDLTLALRCMGSVVNVCCAKSKSESYRAMIQQLQPIADILNQEV